MDSYDERMNEIDPEDAMMASHSLKRAAMMKSSAVKDRFEKARLEAMNAKSIPIGRRQMMPTDLEKWSKDERRQDEMRLNQQRHESSAKLELREFVDSHGALIQKIGLERAIAITQDQAIIGDSSSFELLLGLLRPMAEKAKMSEAFQALDQHVQESTDLLQSTLEASQRELDHYTQQGWTRDVQLSLPSTEEFQQVVSPSEQLQLSIDPAQMAQIVSGFNIFESSAWQLPDRTPNLDASPQFVVIVPQGQRTLPTPQPTREEDLKILDSIHDSLVSLKTAHSSSERPELATSGGYYSAEDD
jgi:hypothetical protein